jgi:hypothetical protein
MIFLLEVLSNASASTRTPSGRCLESAPRAASSSAMFLQSCSDKAISICIAASLTLRQSGGIAGLERFVK